MTQAMFDEMFEGLLDKFTEGEQDKIVNLYDAAEKFEGYGYENSTRAKFKDMLKDLHNKLTLVAMDYDVNAPTLPDVEEVDYIPEGDNSLQKFSFKIFHDIELYLRELGLNIY